jgi:hypothetical protein
MKSQAVLIHNGLNPDKTDFIIEDHNLIGSHSVETGVSHLYKCVVILSEENDNELTITTKALKEIAQSCDVLITDMGCDVHNHSLKTSKVYEGFEIQKMNIKKKIIGFFSSQALAEKRIKESETTALIGDYSTYAVEQKESLWVVYGEEKISDELQKELDNLFNN